MDDVHLKRRLTAVLLADVVGYSRLMSADEEGTHLRLTDYVQNLIDPAVAKHRGRLIRSMGDGMLVEFDSAVDAVRCGIESSVVWPSANVVIMTSGYSYVLALTLVT
jgi:class 3 adenylate cyclase